MCCSGQRSGSSAESQAMREQVLASAGMAVDYQGKQRPVADKIAG